MQKIFLELFLLTDNFDMVRATWKGNYVFEADSLAEHKITMGSSAKAGERASYMSPVEALLASLAGCAGMDMIHYLKVKHQHVTEYKLETSMRSMYDPDTSHYQFSFQITHILQGENLNQEAVHEALRLTNEACTVMGILSAGSEVHADVVILKNS